MWHLVLVTGEGVSVGRGTGGWWAGSLTSQRRRPGSLDVDVAFPHSPTSLTERNGLTQVAPSKRPADRRKGLAAPRSLVGTLLFSVPALFPPAASLAVVSSLPLNRWCFSGMHPWFSSLTTPLSLPGLFQPLSWIPLHLCLSVQVLSGFPHVEHSSFNMFRLMSSLLERESLLFPLLFKALPSIRYPGFLSCPSSS